MKNIALKMLMMHYSLEEIIAQKVIEKMLKKIWNMC